MGNIIQEHIDAGWSLVPLTAGKNPGTPGWDQRGAALKSAAGLLNPSWGVGLVHAYSGTMAFDIDDWEATKAYGIDVDALYAAPDAVTILSGRENKGKLLYRMPMGLPLPTKQYKVRVMGDKGRMRSVTVFEMRCGPMGGGGGIQDALPPSIHPDTGQPYQWGGAGHWSRLPYIPATLLKVWNDLAAEHASTPAPVEGVAASWDEIKNALSYIDPDCAYDDWRNVGMALRWQGDRTMESDQAFHIWDTWSQQAPHRYEADKMGKLWTSFRKTTGTLVTLSTIFHLASQNGYVRPAIDVASLFQGAVPAQPAEITGALKPQPPTIDMSLWPPALARRAQEVSDGVGCDPCVPLWAGLAAVCGAIDAQTRLELNPTFLVPPVLWLMTVGDPAAKKSPGSKPMLTPLKNIEREQYPYHKAAMVDWEARSIIHAKDHKVWKAYLEGEGGVAAPDDAPVPGELPAAPEPVKITVMDITSQALVDSATARPRGLLCHLDEMGGWIAKLCHLNSGEDRSAWVVAYEADRYEIERVGKGRKTADNLAVSIYGNVQPRVLATHFNDLAKDGLLQRFLPVVLRNDQDKRGKPLPDFLTSVNQWDVLLRSIFAVQPMVYRLSGDATKAYEGFQDWYQDQKANERLLRASDTFLTAYGKLEGLTGRLILLFHIIEAPNNTHVSADIVERVIRIVRSFVIPTYRYLLDEVGSMSSFDAWLVDYIIQHADQPKITMSEIKRSARAQWDKVNIHNPMMQNQWVMNGMYQLEQHEPGQQPWVARADDGTQEHRGHAEWFINPGLVTMFRDYRLAVVKAKKQRALDSNPTGYRNVLDRVHGLDEIER